MFRDLKEYQEIQRIYQNNVYDSPDDKLFEEAFKEFNTLEELDYLEENIEYVCEKQNFIKKGLDYINKLRKGLKTVKPKTNIKPKDVSKELDNAKKIIQKSDTAIKPNNKVTDIVKSKPKTEVKVDTPKVDTSKIKGDKSGVEKIKDVIKKNPIKSGAAATGALVTTAALTPGGEEKKEETPKVEEKPKEETPKVEVKKEEPKKEKKKKEKPLLSTPMKDTTELGSKVRQVKPGSSRDKAIATNEVRHGSDHVVNLRNQNADFQAMKKGKITKAEFIAKYPKSQTAKKHKLKNIKRGIKSSFDPTYNNTLANNLAEVYRNMYNTPGEENIQESPYGQMTKMRMDKVKDLPKGTERSKPSPDSPPAKPSKPSPELKRPEPTRPTGPTTPKPRPDTGSRGPKTKKPLPKPTPGPKGIPAKMSKEDFGFDAYDLILEYLLGTEQVETIEEANYVMTEMDDQTIHSIVSEMEDALNEINEGMIDAGKAAGKMMGGAVQSATGVVKGGMSGAKAVAKKLLDTMKKLPKPNNPMPPKIQPTTKSGGGMNPATGGYM